MPGDTIKEFYGIKITIDPMSICYLEGVDIDYIETFKYSGFQFNNPNATNTCGCGSSFSV
jgi:iron-sulfur cluster assembly protein